jgi:hypothetical protein
VHKIIDLTIVAKHTSGALLAAGDVKKCTPAPGYQTYSKYCGSLVSFETSKEWCGDSDEFDARFTDGSGCSCADGFVYNSESKRCVPFGNCQGGDTAAYDCGFWYDPSAYCGSSTDIKARFTDGSGCSCGWGKKYDAKAPSGCVSESTSSVRASALQGPSPSGHYSGAVKKLGETVSFTGFAADDGKSFDLDIHASGLSKVDISCKAEQYVVASDGTVTLPNSGTAGNCIHDALKKYDVTIKSIKYDSGKDVVTLAVHKIIDLTIVAKHTSGALAATVAKAQELYNAIVAFVSYSNSMALNNAAPSLRGKGLRLSSPARQEVVLE